MLVNAKPIKAALLRKFQLVQELVVESMSLLGVIQLSRHIDPYAAILLLKILR
jgi:hypothetical protein